MQTMSSRLLQGAALALVALFVFGSWAQAQGAAAPKSEPTNLTAFMPDDVCMAQVLHPSRMIESPLWQVLSGRAFPLGIGVPPGVALERARQDFDPRKILRVTILLASPSEPRVGFAANATPIDEAYIIQFHQPTDFAQLIPAAFPGAKPAETGGHPYYARQFAGQVQAIYPAGRTILVIAAESRLRKMLGENTGERPLLNELRRAGMDHDAVFVAIVDPALKAFEKTIGNTVMLWDATSGQETRTLSGHANEVLCVAFSPDGKRIASSSIVDVKVWDATSGQKTVTLKGQAPGVLRVAFSADGKRIVGGSIDHAVKVWDAASGQEMPPFRGHAYRVLTMAFSPDGKRIASVIASRSPEVEVWDAPQGPATSR